jgi:hypothetical protein
MASRDDEFPPQLAISIDRQNGRVHNVGDLLPAVLGRPKSRRVNNETTYPTLQVGFAGAFSPKIFHQPLTIPAR